MQGSGYLYTILPQLRKIYGDDTPELKEVMKTHTQFSILQTSLIRLLQGSIWPLKKKKALLENKQFQV